MLDDFSPIVHVIKGRTIKVWTVADVHIGSKECQLEAFRAFLRRVMDDDDSFIVCCGDLINNGVKDSLTNVYEETMPPSAQIQLAAELLKPLADIGKILGMVGGNHEARSAKSVNIDPGYTIACMAGCPELYRQRMAFVRVRLVRGSNCDSYSILLVHGKTANKKKQFSYAVEGIDAIVAGHTHIGEISKPTKIVFNNRGNVEFKTVVSVTATSWLGWGGYAASALYLPNATANPQYLELQFINSHNAYGEIRVGW